MQKTGKLSTESVTHSLVFRDQDTLATGSTEGLVQLWDVRSSKALPAVQLQLPSHVEIGALRFHPIVHHCLLVGSGAAVLQVDLRASSVDQQSCSAGEEESRGRDSVIAGEGGDAGEEDEINWIAVNARGFCATANDQGRVQVHELVSAPSPSSILPECSTTITANGTTLLSSPPPAITAVQPLQIRSNSHRKRLSGKHHTNVAMQVVFRPRKTSELLSVGLDGRLLRWDFAKGRLVEEVVDFLSATTSSDIDEDDNGPSLANPRFAYCLDVSERDDKIVVGLGDGSIALLEQDVDGGSATKLSKWKRSWLQDGHSSFVVRTFLADHDRRILSAGNDGCVNVWTPADKQIVGKFSTTRNRAINDMAFESGSGRIAVADDESKHVTLLHLQ